MKKNFINYIIAWGVLLGLFNLVAFIVPSLNKFTESFWIGYGFITAAFIGQLACAATVFNQNDNQKVFYNITIFQASYTGLIATFIAGAICMVTPFPYFVSVIICAVVLALNVLAIFKRKMAVDAVSAIDKKIKTQTFFIKSLTIDAETLMASAKSESAKAECRKVAEALKYSDPMSSDALSSVETQITLKFAKLSDAVHANDDEKIAELAGEVVILVGDRNKKCKLLK